MHSYTIVDVFTDVPLRGNPVAVFTEAGDLTTDQMQRTARELNLSETVFVTGGADDEAQLRIFTPITELAFAGHPVLGAAFVIAARSDASAVRLQIPAGVVPVTLRRAGDAIVYGEMEQPIPVLEEIDAPARVLEAIGVTTSELPVQAYRNGPLHVYVMLASESTVARLRPDLRLLSELGKLGVSCFAGAGNRFKTRMFAPGLGVAEDPATGSAAGPLALHLARHGLIDFGAEIEIRQGEEIRRPSLLYARVEGNPEQVNRVLVGGNAVVVGEGRYRLT